MMYVVLFDLYILGRLGHKKTDSAQTYYFNYYLNNLYHIYSNISCTQVRRIPKTGSRIGYLST